MAYWIIIDGTRRGPLSLEEVLAEPALTPETPVWHDGMDDWAEAQLLPELEILFTSQPASPFDSECPPPMPSTAPIPPQSGYRTDGRPSPVDRDPAPAEMPSNYLVPAIIATICCCFVTGIVAIVYSSKVSTAFYHGDIERARHYSSLAMIWVIVSFVLGLIIMPFWFLAQIMIAL